MPTIKRNWRAHPHHLETHPDRRKIFTKFGPKPNHPVGSRRIDSALCIFINETCASIVNNASWRLNENHWLCTKCYEQEFNRFETTTREQLHMDMQRLKIGEYFCESDGKENMADSPNLIEEKRDYCIKKLNEVFKMFHIAPVVP